MTASTLPDRLHAPAQPALTASRSSVAWSAALAVGMLPGYFVLAVALVAGLGFLAFEAVTRPGTAAIGGKLGLITGLVAVAVLRAAFVVERRGDEAQDGVLVSRQDEPELWALVDEVSASSGSRRRTTCGWSRTSTPSCTRTRACSDSSAVGGTWASACRCCTC